jgi:hypothetical protein
MAGNMKIPGCQIQIAWGMVKRLPTELSQQVQGLLSRVRSGIIMEGNHSVAQWVNLQRKLAKILTSARNIHFLFLICIHNKMHRSIKIFTVFDLNWKFLR